METTTVLNPYELIIYVDLTFLRSFLINSTPLVNLTLVYTLARVLNVKYALLTDSAIITY